MKKIIILGKGGHAQSIVDTIESLGIYEITGYVVNDDLNEAEENDYPVIGQDKDLENIYLRGIRFAAIGIGFLGKGMVRKKLYERLIEIGFSVPVICDPTAVVSKRAIVGEGTFIGKGTIINSGARIGKMCIINTGAIIEHDCRIDDFTHIAVGTVLCGNVHIGCETLIGANATVIQGRKIGSGCIVGAGEVVRKNIKNEEI